MRVFSCEQMRKIEENAFNKGMSYIEMMENAGCACFSEIIKNSYFEDDSKFCIVCGSGKNGGDGFVIARYLFEQGLNVSVVLACGEPKATEAKIMYDKIKKTKIKIIDAISSDNDAFDVINDSEFIVDCIFGIGFKGEIRGNTKEIVNAINTSVEKVSVFSVDIPSGLEGDKNLVSGECVKADYTLAVTCKKPVHAMKPSVDYCGKVIVVDIGFSEDCYLLDDGYMFNSFDDSFVKSTLPERKFDSNKGSFGKLLCICGSVRMQGAAVLCSSAAVRSGAGIVISAFPDKAYCAIASKLTEPLMLPLPSDDKGFFSLEATDEILTYLKNASAVVIGCGIGVTDATKEIVKLVVSNAKCPVLIDADGLNVLSENIDILKDASAPVVVTPHPGEMSRLLKKSVDEIQADRIAACKELYGKSGAVVLLKGANTVIHYNGETYINSTGNPGMAKGGSGDVLSGVIGALLAQGVDPFKSAVCGAFIHGKAGDCLNDVNNEITITPSDIIDFLTVSFRLDEVNY